MKGAIAAGHPLTARAGAQVLSEGGNAVDAAVAAAFVSWVAESPVTGPGAGGFMLVHRSHDQSTRVLDFFTAVPGRGANGAELRPMDTIEVDFSGGSKQEFRIGGASVAVPGAALGLEQAQRSYGTLPWRELFAPAIELARGGVELTPGQAYLHEILDLILRHTPESRAVYEQDGARLSVGDRLVQPDLARTLEVLRDDGARELYGGELGRAVAAHVRGLGGLLKLLEERAVVTRGTTHISVVDGAGNMVALTASTGAGSGVVVPDTGIHLNNMIGEFTLPRTPSPGARLSSGMSPSIVVDSR